MIHGIRIVLALTLVVAACEQSQTGGTDTPAAAGERGSGGERSGGGGYVGAGGASGSAGGTPGTGGTGGSGGSPPAGMGGSAGGTLGTGGTGGSGGSPPAGMGGSGPMGAPPLSERTFVFQRKVRSNAVHIMAYDLDQRTERPISALDDDGSHGSTLPGYTPLSPNRRWIAFTSWFRPSAEDLQTQTATQILWRLSVDGRMFARVSDPLPRPATASAFYLRDLTKPSWWPDGNTILTVLGQADGSAADGTLTAALEVVKAPASGGPLSATGIARNCYSMSGVAPSPSGRRLALIQNYCSPSGLDGLAVWDLPSNTPHLLVPQQRISGRFALSDEPPVWLPDESAVLFVKWVPYGNSIRIGLFLFTLAGGVTSPIFEPTATLSVSSFALSRDGRELVLGLESQDAAGQWTKDLWLTELPAPPAVTGSLERLTHDGASSQPSF